MAAGERGLNLDLHRAMGSTLDAAMFLNALMHSEAVNPGNIAVNVTRARQALQGALLYLAKYDSGENELMSRAGD